MNVISMISKGCVVGMVYVDSENEGTETEEGPFDGDPGQRRGCCQEG
jgi:hypothetical protein